ncbi:MAG: SDR family NAD(P)-dependent oxidoreductase [Alphaproteobacteria bacterium]
MKLHPAIQEGRAAVITGGASGIGLEAAKRLARHGMRIAIADVNEERLASAAAAIDGDIMTVHTDVSQRGDVERLKDEVYGAFGEVAILMNNAGVGDGGGPFENYEGWERVLGTNLWGVINGVQAFSAAMIAQGTPAAIINTGSKQGITCPPGDTAYNVSKAGVKVTTEGLQHALRSIEGCQVSAHLLVPGFTFTPLVQGDRVEKPEGAWWPEQVVDYLMDHLGRGDFYIICPDNEVSSQVDRLRITWAAGDVTENRPPLSRWHPDYGEAFADFVRRSGV